MTLEPHGNVGTLQPPNESNSIRPSLSTSSSLSLSFYGFLYSSNPILLSRLLCDSPSLTLSCSFYYSIIIFTLFLTFFFYHTVFLFCLRNYHFFLLVSQFNYLCSLSNFLFLLFYHCTSLSITLSISCQFSLFLCCLRNYHLPCPLYHSITSALFKLSFSIILSFLFLLLSLYHASLLLSR